jgi:hypothetical protein
MIQRATLSRLAMLASAMAIAASVTPAGAQQKSTIAKLTGVWVEGPGYDVTYGATYDVCAARCLGAEKCAMLEYYRPEKKCNLYDTVRPRKTGGASFVGIKG